MIDETYFDRDYFEKGMETGKSAYDVHAFELGNDVFEHQAQMLTEVLKLKGKRVLEVGCARGNLVHYLRKLDVEACGQDVSMWAWVHSHAPLYHKMGDIQYHAYVYDADAIVSFHTMEHVADPAKALKNMHKSMKQGAIFFGVIPSDGHEQDASGVSMLSRDEWHKLLTENGFIERKDLHDKFFWHPLMKKWNWEGYCYERN